MLAVELTSLGSPIPASYWTKDNNHCTSGGAPLELCVCVFVSLRDPSLCRVIQVQIDLLFGLNLHTTSGNEIFFKKYFI